MSQDINIIKEFEKLLIFIQSQIDESIQNKQPKVTTANQFRLRQNKNIIALLKKISLTKEITLDFLDELKEYPGIGKGTIDRIREILEKGSLSELKDFTFNSPINNKKEKALEELETIVGVGRSKALEFINNNIYSVDQLKKAIDNDKIKVNDKILLGVKYYNVFKGDIPREEIDNIKKIIKSVIKKMNKDLDEDEQFIFTICGSYRRMKDTSGDIDILISKLDSNEDINDTNYLELFVSKLKKNIKKNDNKPLLVDDITDKNYETKYMGFAKYLDNFVRRIDIRFVPYIYYYPALLYFTGSADLNKKMRQIAKSMGYKLSEYGLTKISDGSHVPINSEEEYFKILKIEYLKPSLR